MLGLRRQFAFMIINDVFDLKSLVRTGSPSKTPTQTPTIQTPAPKRKPATFAPVSVPDVFFFEPVKPDIAASDNTDQDPANDGSAGYDLIEIDDNGSRRLKIGVLLLTTTSIILNFM